MKILVLQPGFHHFCDYIYIYIYIFIYIYISIFIYIYIFPNEIYDTGTKFDLHLWSAITRRRKQLQTSYWCGS